MPKNFTSICDKCILNSGCTELNAIDKCDMYCTSVESPLYRAFRMGYETGFAEYSDEYEEELIAWDEMEEEDDEFNGESKRSFNW